MSALTSLTRGIAPSPRAHASSRGARGARLSPPAFHPAAQSPGLASIRSISGSVRPLAAAPRRSVPASRSRVLCSAAAGEKELANGVYEGYWDWKGFKIRYQRKGDEGPGVMLIHGFGGNADHFRKNTPDLGESCRTFAIDLLGYGYSSKPDPRLQEPNTIYTFENWADLMEDFRSHFLGEEPCFLVCNSVGGVAGLQHAVNRPDKVKGVVLLDISLRGLHVTKQPPIARPFIKAFQQVLRDTPVGRLFFAQVASPRAVKNVLSQAYGRKDAVTDELVDCILKPGMEEGAVDVFLDFISYSGGPLPEELLPKCKVPVCMAWGEEDPWELIDLGRKEYSGFPAVEEFIPLPGVGHCPQDEAPELVNPIVIKFVERHSSVPLATATAA